MVNKGESISGNGNTNPYAIQYTDTIRHANADSYIYLDAFTNQHIYTDAHTYLYAYLHANIYTDQYLYTHADRDTNANIHINTIADANVITQPNTLTPKTL